jgi:hypothetical protein
MRTPPAAPISTSPTSNDTRAAGSNDGLLGYNSTFVSVSPIVIDNWGVLSHALADDAHNGDYLVGVTVVGPSLLVVVMSKAFVRSSSSSSDNT